jgi:hypothetical protein
MRTPFFVQQLTCAALLLALCACSTIQSTPMTFNETQFAQLKFLEGRYKGVGPDNKPFYEEYVFAGPSLLQSNRYADATFAARTDGSTVALKDGVVTSTWGQFTWKAISLSPTKACFEPVNAPSSFCWERMDKDTVHATQRWTGADGKEQSYVVPLSRLPA